MLKLFIQYKYLVCCSSCGTTLSKLKNGSLFGPPGVATADMHFLSVDQTSETVHYYRLSNYSIVVFAVRHTLKICLFNTASFNGYF